MKKFYITTAIDYVNAPPHIGHAFEKVIADALARWHKLQGKDVFFLTGVDENAQKNVEAAQKQGIPTKEFIDKNAKLFLKLCKELNTSHNKFIRTTAKEHEKVVHEILKKIIKKGDIYKGHYSGLYCTGCEEFKTEKDLINGKCPEHDKPLKTIKEEAYFFKLSKYQNKIIKFAEDYITPKSKRNEIVSRLKKGLNDLCITRKGANWGIDFPQDPKYKVYVWVDALINYISGSKENWPADLHVIGKGINWFHSVIWPALLMSAGYKLPNKLLVHGYLNIGGRKMSKSIGNTINPLDLLKKYPTDTVRYSLLRNSIFEDSDYSEETLVERHNNELANKLGNLVSRVSTLAEKYEVEKGNIDIDTTNIARRIKDYFDNYELDRALNSIFGFVDSLNQLMQDEKPWETKDKSILYELITGIRTATILLWPFIPETSEKIAKTFGFKLSLDEIKKPLKITKIKKSPILFQKIK